MLVSLHGLTIFLKVELQGLNVVVKPQGGHGKEDIFTVDGPPLLSLTPVARLARDERDELGHALLDALARIFGDLALKINL